MRQKRLPIIILGILISLRWFAASALAQQPTDSYDGPLVESHAHIDMYQSLTEVAVQYRVDAREGATELTAASYVSSLDRNSIKCTLGFHAIAFDDKQAELLDHARRLLLLYPDRFILFAEIFRNNPLEWFDAAKLDSLLGTGLFSGFGEIQFLNPPLGEGVKDGTLFVKPNDERFLNIYGALGDRGLFVMAHPGSREGVDEAVSHDPRATWIIHGPQVHTNWTEISELGKLLDRHPNLYFTLDIGESLPEWLQLTKTLDPPGGAAPFLAKMNDPDFFNALLEKMVFTWKDAIEARPDRFLWGTDMGVPTWQWQEPGVIDMMVKFSRAFIGRLAPSAGENYAYRNAERVLGGCPVPVEIDIKPGSSPNSINLGSGGTVPVAIMSTSSFDATTVDPTTVTLESARVQLKGKGTPMASFEDVNRDGLLDLVIHVSTDALQFSDTDTVALLGGKTFAGAQIRGRDTVRVVP